MGQATPAELRARGKDRAAIDGPCARRQRETTAVRV